MVPLLGAAPVPASADIDFAARTGSGPIKVAHSGMCLTVPGANPAETVQIVQQACTGAAEQTWRIQPAGNGFSLVNQATGLCMDSQTSRTNGSAVWQIRCRNLTQQTWSAQAQGAGVRLNAAYSGKCLDVYGGSRAVGERLIQWDCWGGDNQTFVPAPSPVAPPTTGGGTSGGTGGGTTGTTSVTLTLTAINGWYAKEVFLFVRNASGAVTAQTTVASYNFGAATAGLNTPSQPIAVPAGSTWGAGLRIWANGDKSRRGTPILYYSDTPNQRALQSSGNCAAGGRQDAWGDAGTAGRNVLYTLNCTAPTGTGTGGGTVTDPGTGGTGTGGGTSGTGTGGTGTGTGTGGTGTGGTGTGGTGGTDTGGGTGGTGTGGTGTGTGTATWTRCATENQTCAFSGTRTVRYGANGTYATRTAAGPIACNNATFGDPLYGVAKACDLQDAAPTGTGAATATAVTLTPTSVDGWFAKEVFLFTRNADGSVGPQTLVLSYNFGATPAGMNTPSQPITVPAGGRWAVGLRIWANQDKSRNGTPILYYSDTPNERALQTSGDCAAGGRQDVWGDSGAPGRNVIYTLRCTATTGTGTGTGGTGGTGTGGTGTGTGADGGTVTPPPGEPAPTGASVLINRRSGNCVDGAGNGVLQQICRDPASQNWTFLPASGGYQIRNATTGQCLAVENAGTGNGARVVQQGCSTAANALFRLRKLDKWTEIVATHSGRCLSPTGGNDNRNSGSAIVQWDCDSADPQRWTILGPEGRAPSAWTAPRGIGIVPVAGAVLPNGKVVFWAAEQRTSFNSGNGTWTTLYDPATDRSVDTYVANTGHNMFCPGTNVLPDGRILITGGITAGVSTIYDPAANTWTRVADMNITRGYNASTTLSNGDSFTYGGSWSGGAGGKDGEVWSPSTNRWRVLRNVKGEAAADPSVPVYPGDTHYWLFAGSNGSVFHAGPSTDMHWIDTSGDGSLRSVGKRGNDRFAVNGTANMYDIGKIYKAGGAPAYTGVPSLDTAFTIDIGAGPNGAVSVAETAPMLFPRTYMNSVVLPDGDIVTVGGQIVAAQFTDNLPVMMPEIWSPRTGKVRRLAPMAIPRNYHSIAMLMLDGRVLVGGGGLCGGCGGADHLDFEILTPPNLFDAQGNLASRPTITAAPTGATVGGTLSVTTDRAVTGFSLVRLSSVTHSTNTDQRRVPLAVTQSGTSHQLALPTDPGILLPGTWMLFAMDAAGVPSVAKVVRIR
ncbi:hypothetical protein HNR00_004206 [Methylorubrum rhodinum]|uniref:Ricin B lectin domain-containing protein n=1 Tax=Methylorubrum rhodinum TaxID=29428 RepID=A0A840ZMQ9_9HYPH|nr:RICIN domain-containing protein [Methylorubrum rhodinum]MBB5759472.1 hypothetical protein [Methylorubrum rhodinum]